jgi:hypothetical protein
MQYSNSWTLAQLPVDLYLDEIPDEAAILCQLTEGFMPVSVRH